VQDTRAAPSRASASATWNWMSALSRTSRLEARGSLSRASSMKASRLLRAMPIATPEKPAA